MPTRTLPRSRPKAKSTSAVLRPSKGFAFKKVGTRRMALMRQADGLGVATISCGCSGRGTCGITIDMRGGAKCEGTCSGGCKWVVTSVGLTKPLFIA